jgi:hypothetical protein
MSIPQHLEQRDIIFSFSQLNQQSPLFLIDIKWWQEWCKYVNYKTVGLMQV